MKSKRYIMVSSVVILFLVAVGLAASRPAMPGAWRNLRLGMSQGEVESVIAGTTGQMIGGGGGEAYQHMSTMLGTRCYWWLTVQYNADPNYGGKVVAASAKFVHPGCRLLNRKTKLT